eukprot:354873-Chlamydomonas_euryale.AAC.2
MLHRFRVWRVKLRLRLCGPLRLCGDFSLHRGIWKTTSAKQRQPAQRFTPALANAKNQSGGGGRGGKGGVQKRALFCHPRLLSTPSVHTSACKTLPFHTARPPPVRRCLPANCCTGRRRGAGEHGDRREVVL